MQLRASPAGRVYKEDGNQFFLSSNFYECLTRAKFLATP
jgi:hypothetical protein